jgi:hypothetical protein
MWSENCRHRKEKRGAADLPAKEADSMSRFGPVRIAAALVALCGVAALPTQAAEPVFPPTSRIGLSPPAGFVPSRAFTGFEDRERQSLIVIRELPPVAYEGLDRAMTEEALTQQGIALEGRESVTLPTGPAVLMSGRQVENGVALKKWVLLASTPELTGVVTVQVPDAERGTYPEPAVRSALMSLAIRAKVPTEEQLGVLPYRLRDLGGFRIVRVIPGNAAALTDGPNDTIEFSDQPLILITTAPGAPTGPDDWNAFGRRAFAGIPGIKNVQLSRAGPLRIGGQPGHEIVADAEDVKSNAAISIVQWLRFGPSSHLRIVAIARRDAWPKMFTRFRALRDGIELR